MANLRLSSMCNPTSAISVKLSHRRMNTDIRVPLDVAYRKRSHHDYAATNTYEVEPGESKPRIYHTI